MTNDDQDRNKAFVLQMSEHKDGIKDGEFFPGTSLTIGKVTALAAEYDAAIQSSARLVIDLTEIAECDTAGIQLLIAMNRRATALEKSCLFRAPSSAVSAVSHRIGVDLADIVGE